VRLNAVLADTEARVKGEFAAGELGYLDRSLGQLDDVVAMWKVARACEAAWGRRSGRCAGPRSSAGSTSRRPIGSSASRGGGSCGPCPEKSPDLT
jgi:hypothetical protein